MNLSQKIAFNTIIQFTGRIFTAVSTLVITMIISWKLGAEGLGQYVRITSYVTIWFVLLDFGINPIAVKAISKITDLEKQKVALRNNFQMLLGLRTAVTLVILILATAILFILPAENYTPVIRTAIMIAYIQIIGQSIVSSSMPVFQVTLSYFWATLSNLIGSIVSLVAVLVTVSMGGTLLQIVIASMAGWLLIGFMTYFFAGRIIGFVRPEIDLKKWINLLKQALPVGIALLFNVIFVKLNMQLLQVLNMDNDVIAKYGNVDAQTGYYGIALRFFDIMIAIPFFFSNAIFPTLVQRKEESSLRLRELMNKALDIMVMVGLPMSVGGIILAPQIIYYISGGFLPGANSNEFIPAIPALQILIFGIGVFFTTGVITWTPIIMNKQLLLTKIYGIVLFVTIIANILLIPRFGYLGAAIITVLGEFLAFGLNLYYAHKLIHFRYNLKFFAKTLALSCVMGLAIYPFRNDFILIPLFVGALIYVSLGLLIKVIDIQLIKSMVKK